MNAHDFIEQKTGGQINSTHPVIGYDWEDVISWMEEYSQKPKRKRAKAEFVPPTYEEFYDYCFEHGFKHIANQAYEGYRVANWHDSTGKKIKNWKQKLHHVWFKEGNKPKDQSRASQINSL